MSKVEKIDVFFFVVVVGGVPVRWDIKTKFRREA